ncbi:LOW QUALITY PROTEIN: hypothetical protein MAR_004043 [Mya arenaria]|uniref:Uncharacterized protein n=1 Tax=Mya arenaria TaxID=6604 RepID=A0ABY7EVH8_MYAAR|nr:LOW QUALITY PROTEIN: hypothetical protein MAR_004043 [Mya arenaria]
MIGIPTCFKGDNITTLFVKMTMPLPLRRKCFDIGGYDNADNHVLSKGDYVYITDKSVGPAKKLKLQ